MKKFISFTILIIIVKAQPKDWTPELSIKVKSISDLNFSNNNQIAMVVREALIDGKKSTKTNELMTMNGRPSKKKLT